MATVRISQVLRQTISQNASKAFEASYPVPKLSDEDSQFIVAAVENSTAQREMRKIVEAVDDLKEKFKGQFNLNDASVFHEKKFGGGESIKFNYPLCTENEGQSIAVVLVPINETLTVYTGSYSYYGFSIHTNNLPAEYRPRVTEICKDIHLRKTDRDAKRDKYVTQLNALLERCTTLKQLVNAWPQVKAFVPEEFLAKMEERVQRTKPRDIAEEVEFDSELATGVAVAAKLTGVV